MRTLMAILTLGCFFALAGLAVAGPFGTEMGQKPEDFQDLEKINESGYSTSYFTTNVPKQNSFFTGYGLTFGKNGLALVIGTSDSYENDAYGTHVKKDYEILKNQLTKKYGKPESFDFLKSQSIWNKDRDFAMSLLKNERKLESFWVENLPDNIASIHLRATASSPTETSFRLVYEYKNFDEIRKEKDKASRDSL